MPPPLGLAIDLDTATSDVAEVLPNLFVGGREAAKHPPDAVRRIVNVTQFEPCHHADSGVEYLHLEVDDNENAKISKYFEQSNAFIAAAMRAGEAVLVHCKEGISRSTTLVIAYLLAHEGRTLAEALAQVQGARSVAKPNRGFMEELQSRLELTQFVVKVLQTINKEAFIRKQSKKIKAVLSILFGLLEKESLCLIYKQKVVKTVMGLLSTVLEPSVVNAVDEIIK